MGEINSIALIEVLLLEWGFCDCFIVYGCVIRLVTLSYIETTTYMSGQCCIKLISQTTRKQNLQAISPYPMFQIKERCFIYLFVGGLEFISCAIYFMAESSCTPMYTYDRDYLLLKPPKHQCFICLPIICAVAPGTYSWQQTDINIALTFVQFY